MKSEVITSGVVIELNGKYWGIVYQDAHDGTSYDWGDLANAVISDPRYLHTPAGITYSGSPDVQRLAGARLVPVTKIVTIELGAAT